MRFYPDLDSPFHDLHFAPRGQYAIPEDGISDEPSVMVRVNVLWLGHLLGVIDALDQPDAWAGNETEIESARAEIRRLFTVIEEQTAMLPTLHFHPWQFSPDVGTWSRGLSSGAHNGFYIYNSSNSSGDKISCPLFLPAGSYKCALAVFKGAGQGLLSLNIVIDETTTVTFGNEVLYSTSSAYNHVVTKDLELEDDTLARLELKVENYSGGGGSANQLTLQSVVFHRVD